MKDTTTARKMDTATAKEYTIDELSRAADTTVRNVRAYQDRGLLPPPEIRGRTGIYSDAHLSRLRIITRLLDRGYTLSNIAELLESWQQGSDISEILGLETAVASPWSDEVPDYLTLPQVIKKFGKAYSGKALKKAIELELLIPEGTRFRVPSPRMLYAGSELVDAGVPLEAMLDVVASLRENVERAAEAMVMLIEDHVFGKYDGELPPAQDVPQLAELVWRLRPLVEMAVLPEVARAMEKAATKHLGDRLAKVFEHLHEEQHERV